MNPLKKELYVAQHGQSTRFRIVKYAIMHLFYRWKTNAWQDSWDGYKSLFK